MNHERQDFHISLVYSLGQDFLHRTIFFFLVTLTLNLKSHALNVAIHIWLPLGELHCLLTTLVCFKIWSYCPFINIDMLKCQLPEKKTMCLKDITNNERKL